MTDDPLPIREVDPTDRLSAHLPPPSPSRRWRLLDRLVVVAFCIGLVVPAVLMAARVRPAEIENRPLLKAPPITLGSLLDAGWYASVDRFIADNIAVRPLAVRIRGQAYLRLGGTGNPAVVRGTDSWLFTLDEIQARCDLGVADISAALDRTAAAFTAAGQEFRFLVAPDKHVIYPEKLDPGMPYGPSCTDDRRSAMRTALDQRSGFAVDGWAAVLAARAGQPDGPPLYYTQDSHWTTIGAVPAIHALIDTLGTNLWREADVVLGRPRRVVMELARQVGLYRTEAIPSVRVRPTVHIVRATIDLPFKITHARAVYRFTAAGDRPIVPGVTVIVYDSFFGLNVAAVAPFFAESIWIHVGDLQSHPEIAKLIGPVDRVILERVERGLYFGPIDDLLRPLVRTGG